jgi:hypothetical protein
VNAGARPLHLLALIGLLTPCPAAEAQQMREVQEPQEMRETREVPEAPDARPGFIVARVPERGQVALLLAAGSPFATLSLDYGLFGRLALGLGYDFSTGGFSRAGAHLRVRALRFDRAELGVRLSLSAILPRANSGFGARSIAQTGDGELGLQMSYAFLPTVALFGEGAVLGETDFGRPHTAAFLELGGGAEWAAVGPFVLLGRLGVIRGARGSARTFAAGGGVHF